MKRRTFLLSSMAGAASILTEKRGLFSPTGEAGGAPFALPVLPYSTDALEPYIDRATMEIHHDKHHGAYVANLNKAVAGTEWESRPIDEILANISKVPAAVRNNGGGHFNHSLFWNWLKPGGGGGPEGELAEAIRRDFGSFEKFKDQFTSAAMMRFGSGWAWLVLQHGKLVVASSPNQDNPAMDIAEVRGTPVLGLDVWEHAYYLKYQNRRADYVAAWWNVVNWGDALTRFTKAR